MEPRDGSGVQSADRPTIEKRIDYLNEKITDVAPSRIEFLLRVLTRCSELDGKSILNGDQQAKLLATSARREVDDLEALASRLGRNSELPAEFFPLKEYLVSPVTSVKAPANTASQGPKTSEPSPPFVSMEFHNLPQISEAVDDLLRSPLSSQKERPVDVSHEIEIDDPSEEVSHHPQTFTRSAQSDSQRDSVSRVLAESSPIVSAPPQSQDLLEKPPSQHQAGEDEEESDSFDMRSQLIARSVSSQASPSKKGRNVFSEDDESHSHFAETMEDVQETMANMRAQLLSVQGQLTAKEETISLLTSQVKSAREADEALRKELEASREDQSRRYAQLENLYHCHLAEKDNLVKSLQEEKQEGAGVLNALQSRITLLESRNDEATAYNQRLKDEHSKLQDEALKREASFKAELEQKEADARNREEARRAQFSKREEALKSEFLTREEALKLELSKREESMKAEFSKREDALKAEFAKRESKALEREEALKAKLSQKEELLAKKSLQLEEQLQRSTDALHVRQEEIARLQTKAETLQQVIDALKANPREPAPAVVHGEQSSQIAPRKLAYDETEIPQKEKGAEVTPSKTPEKAKKADAEKRSSRSTKPKANVEIVDPLVFDGVSRELIESALADDTAQSSLAHHTKSVDAMEIDDDVKEKEKEKEKDAAKEKETPSKKRKRDDAELNEEANEEQQANPRKRGRKAQPKPIEPPAVAEDPPQIALRTRSSRSSQPDVSSSPTRVLNLVSEDEDAEKETSSTANKGKRRQEKSEREDQMEQAIKELAKEKEKEKQKGKEKEKNKEAEKENDMDKLKDREEIADKEKEVRSKRSLSKTAPVTNEAESSSQVSRKRPTPETASNPSDEDAAQPKMKKSRLQARNEPVLAVPDAPPKDAVPPKQVIISYTGINDITETEEIRGMAAEMKARVEAGSDPFIGMTHLITPNSSSKTLKVIVAALTGAWIVPLSWLRACAKEGAWVDESSYGHRVATNILEDQAVGVSASFISQQNVNSKLSNLNTMLFASKGASFTEDLSQANIILMVDPNEVPALVRKYPNAKVLSWEIFIHCVVGGKFKEAESASPIKNAVADSPKDPASRSSSPPKFITESPKNPPKKPLSLSREKDSNKVVSEALPEKPAEKPAEKGTAVAEASEEKTGQRDVRKKRIPLGGKH